MGNKYYLAGDLFFSKTSDFLDVFLIRQCNRSRKTSDAYRDALTVFKRYVENKGFTVLDFRFKDCTYDFLLDYKAYLEEEKKYCASSINQRLAAIKSYVKYASSGDASLAQVYISIAAVPKSKVPKLQRPVVKEDALKVMINEPPQTPKGLRDTLIMSLLYDTAIRLDELVRLKRGDIYIRESDVYLIIHGKGNKERKVSLDDKTAELLNIYLQEFHSSGQPETPLIYTIIKGEIRQMSHRNVQMLLKKYGEQAKKDNAEISGNAHPHLLRRSRATELYQNGIPIEMVSRFLGHSSIETTKTHYAFASLEQLKAAMEKASSPGALTEKPLWEGHEEELAVLCGLRK